MLNFTFNSSESYSKDQPPHTALIPQPFTLPAFKNVIARWQTYMQMNNGWNTVFLENHDMARSVSRYLLPLNPASPVDLRARGAKLLAILCCTLWGTLFVYQGQEIGMSNVPSTWSIEMFRDVASLNYYREYAPPHTYNGVLFNIPLQDARETFDSFEFGTGHV